MNLPKDVYMLLSFVNTKLRDQYDGLDGFCEDFAITKLELQERLFEIGYRYVPEENQFKML